MMCAWRELLTVLPPGLRPEVDRVGKESLEELRLRINAPPELVVKGGSQWLKKNVTADDLNFVVNAASSYSPWAAATVAQGYLTAPGGHRIGLCGEAVCKHGEIDGIRNVTSLCIRVARDVSQIAGQWREQWGSVLILGAPGWGKTTLLRDLCRTLAETEQTAVVDERGELFPKGFIRGRRMDVLTGCPKTLGIDMVLRTMGPGAIAVDEITEAGDCQAIVHASNCGVRLLATAHASSFRDFQSRIIYKPLIENGIFETLLILHRNRSYHVERMTL